MSSFCSTEINAYANNIWEDIGSPPTTSVGYIASWLTVSGNLGRLNGALDTCYWVSGGSCITPNPTPEVLAIYELIYRKSYYEGQRSSLLTSLAAGISSYAYTWTQLTEGDSKISRVAPTESLKQFNASLIEDNKQLRLAIGDFRRNNSLPQTVNAASLASYPTP